MHGTEVFIVILLLQGYCVSGTKFFNIFLLVMIFPLSVYCTSATLADLIAGSYQEFRPDQSHDVKLDFCVRCFRSGSAPLECDQDFWDLRDSVVQCELLILRQLNFQVSFQHPHKFLLHYLLSVRALLNRHAWARSPVAEASWALLRDCYHGDMCIRHAPQHMAIAAIYLALHSYGVELPRGDKEWWEVLCSDVTRADIDAVISDLLQLYDLEAKCV
uniref:Cyclin-Q n=1 Tax=Periophthalmus magnuspinnatus TaxID=409849 RepID=A0A3B4AJT2_9GOBI